MLSTPTKKESKEAIKKKAKVSAIRFAQVEETSFDGRVDDDLEMRSFQRGTTDHN